MDARSAAAAPLIPHRGISRSIMGTMSDNPTPCMIVTIPGRSRAIYACVRTDTAPENVISTGRMSSVKDAPEYSRPYKILSMNGPSKAATTAQPPVMSVLTRVANSVMLRCQPLCDQRLEETIPSPPKPETRQHARKAQRDAVDTHCGRDQHPDDQHLIERCRQRAQNVNAVGANTIASSRRQETTSMRQLPPTR